MKRGVFLRRGIVNTNACVPGPRVVVPFWAPVADKVIASGSEAITLTALRLMPRR